MRIKTLKIIIALSFMSTLIGCKYNETIILNNSEIYSAMKPLIEFKINENRDVRSAVADFGYYRGNVYIAKYKFIRYVDSDDEVRNQYENRKIELEENLYVLNSDKSVKQSELQIPSKYTVNFTEYTNRDYLFSKREMYDWKTGIEKEIINDEMLDKVTIEQVGNGVVRSNLKLVTANDSMARLICTNDSDQQILFVDLNTGEYIVSDIIPYVPSNKIIDVFYNEKDKNQYCILSDGTILGFREEDGKLKHYIYDKIILRDDQVIKRVAKSNQDIYYEVTTGDDLSKNKNILLRYEAENKRVIEIFQNTVDSKFKLASSNDGYMILGNKKDTSNSGNVHSTSNNNCYKYYLGKLNGDEVEIIKAIAEDETNEILEPNIYVNEEENVLLVSSYINNGIEIKYQVFDLN